MKAKEKIGIEAIFAPMTYQEFVTKYYPTKHVITHGNLNRLSKIASLPELKSYRALLNAHKGKAALVYRGELGIHQTVSPFDPEQTRKLYELEQTLILGSVHRSIPELKKWTDALSEQLGLRKEKVASNAFISGSKSGLQPHFDDRETIIIQILGNKRWKLAPNKDVAFPTLGHSAGPYTTPKELQIYCPPLPENMPEDSIVVDMKPGSAIFLPRGYWHSTEAGEESLSITFGLYIPTWLSIFQDMIKTRLLKHAHWREPAALAWGSKTERLAAAKRLEKLISRLEKDLAPIDTKETLENYPFKLYGTPIPVASQAKYQLISGIDFKFEKAQDTGHKMVAVIAEDRNSIKEKISIKVDSAMESLCTWILKQKETFDETSAAEALGIPLMTIRQVFSILNRAGILKKTSTKSI